MQQDEPTYIGVCVCVCVRCREQKEWAMWQSRGELLLDYVKHSHSPEVTTLLWKLKASQRFTVFVNRRLSHSLSGPAPTRYTPHGRLLWTTTATSAAGMSVCLHGEESWRRGEERAKKRNRKRKHGLLVLIQIGSEWWDLAQQSPALYSQLLMATQIKHLTLILLSFSPGTSLGQQSHTLSVTLSFSISRTASTFPLPPLSTSSPLYVWNLLLSCSQPRPAKPDQQIHSPHLALRSGCPLQRMPTRRPWGGWKRNNGKADKGVWECMEKSKWDSDVKKMYHFEIHHLSHYSTLSLLFHVSIIFFGCFLNWLYTWISLSNNKPSTTDIIVPLFSRCQLPCAPQRSLCCSPCYITECVLGL